ncbi:mucin-5B-like [Pygocentrus nattereri]|uniref:mucin-5B-like n=1 Tax=Pygocentrus nattereri TaxID=42514 RepID=UPI00189138EB|nr:mucin-5B-like [Pygocentrus nattereri]
MTGDCASTWAASQDTRQPGADEEDLVGLEKRGHRKLIADESEERKASIAMFNYDFLLDATATEMITPTTVSILPTTGIIADSYESLYGINVNHNMQVCSTWGNFHFSTFDGQFFQLPYTCNYILTTLCDSTKTDFNVQMRRQYINNLPTIRSFTIKIDGVVVKLLDGNITMNDQA